ncbi:MAG TPA: ABC transporter substrate-binding protein [Candidatus Dormibacteraeota bacterium]|nr:ABC transporter substrate-binding protein [Candidatus Dormibacteraeota bacterium]
MRLIRLTRRVVLAALAVLVAGACAPGASNNPSPSGVHGGTIDIIGVWSDGELDSFNAVLAPWEQQTGVTVNFEASRDQDAILTTRVAAGNPPDLAAAPSPTLLNRFAQQKKLVPLENIIDMNKLKSEYAKSWIDQGTINGHLVEVFSWASIKGFIWYNPKVWQQKGYTVPKTWSDLIALQTKMKGAGDTPWCVTVNSGAATGWPGSDIEKEITLGQVGPDIYDKWWQGKQSWTSPEIKGSWQSFGQLLGPGDSNVYGGANYIVNTDFSKVGDPMFASPPKCMMLNQASFITSFFQKAHPELQPGTDFDYFTMPSQNSANEGIRVGAADAFSIFHDTPQARSLINYLVSPEAQEIWVKRGGKIAVNNKVPVTDYPDVVSQKIAKDLVSNTKQLKYDAGDLMPTDMKNAYWQAIVAFIQDQSKLDSILSGLEQVRSTAYTS